ncbi:MAG: DUF1887 family protein [Helicobacteraceae bacterium]|jgi:hypothetical protein|nr:DUF1887 family protein [Helicobacteraceae bacterium]
MILVSLLGEFDSSVLPVFFEFKHEITHHLLIHGIDDRSRQSAVRITSGLNAVRAKFRLKCTLRETQVNANDLKSIYALINEIINMSPPDQLMINASDASASLVIVLSKEALDAGAQLLVYDRYENTITKLTSNGMRKHNIKHNMKIEDHIISKGYTLIEARDVNDLYNRKAHIEQITENFDTFQRFRRRIMLEKNIERERYETVIEPLLKMGVLARNGKILDMNYILGGLFEDIIYFLVASLNFDDILSGVKVSYHTVDNVLVQNEFDVLMIKNNHLYIIECKFRDRVDGENLIYKYDALLDQMDHDGKVMIINVASTESKEAIKRGKRIHKNFEKGALLRAQLNNTLIYYEPTLDTDKLLSMMRGFFDL